MISSSFSMLNKLYDNMFGSRMFKGLEETLKKACCSGVRSGSGEDLVVLSTFAAYLLNAIIANHGWIARDLYAL